MTEHQKARRAAKSAAFFAKRARIAAQSGDLKTARRLGAWAARKQELVAAPVRTFPNFHHFMMARLDEMQKAGATVNPAHAAIRQALRVANMQGRQFASPEALAAAAFRHGGQRAQVLAACA